MPFGWRRDEPGTSGPQAQLSGAGDGPRTLEEPSVHLPSEQSRTPKLPVIRTRWTFPLRVLGVAEAGPARPLPGAGVTAEGNKTECGVVALPCTVTVLDTRA